MSLPHAFHRGFLLAVFALFAGARTAVVFAQPGEEDPPPTENARRAPVFVVHFENDYFGGSDRYYTNGLKLSWLSGDLTSWGGEGWRRKLVEALPFVNRHEGQKNFGFAFGQNIYTPNDIVAVPPDPTDRPYAGWSYIETSFVSRTAHLMDSLSIQAGMVGPHSYADDIQRLVHEWLNDDWPAGWDHQIRDEFGLNVVFERKIRLYARTLENTLGLDLVPHMGASLGNIFTYANIGLTARVGFNLPDDFGVDLIRPAGATTSPLSDEDPRLRPRGGLSLFFFGGGDGRAVARDITLDGNTFKESASVDREVFVADVFYGAGFAWGPWQLTYTHVMRTREFEGQERKNYFGSIALSRVF